MAIIDDLLNATPVAGLPQVQQGSWVKDLIDRQYAQPQTQKPDYTPQGFNFNRNPFDPSTYYKQIGQLRDISHTATGIAVQEANNRQAQALADQQAQDRQTAQNATQGITKSAAFNIGTTLGKSASVVSKIISLGMKEIGKPYVYGDEGPNTFDCSGLMQYIFKNNGVSLPRTAAQQQSVAKRVSSPIAGDLVFYGFPAHHVALYLGNGKMLAAPHTGANVRVQPVYGNPTYGRI